jgi:hypothetical protein
MQAIGSAVAKTTPKIIGPYLTPQKATTEKEKVVEREKRRRDGAGVK